MLQQMIALVKVTTRIFLCNYQ